MAKGQSRRVNIVGKRFGKLIILEFSGQDKHRNSKWLCQCDCGEKKVIRYPNLKQGYTKSCGCLGHQNLPPGESSKRRIFSSYKRKAKDRNLEFSLSMKEFVKLTKSICHYCGASPTAFAKRDLKAPYIGNGIDRKDSSLGYSSENCVPCCKICNRAKFDLLYDDFIEWVNRVSNHLKESG